MSATAAAGGAATVAAPKAALVGKGAQGQFASNEKQKDVRRSNITAAKSETDSHRRKKRREGKTFLSFFLSFFASSSTTLLSSSHTNTSHFYQMKVLPIVFAPVSAHAAWTR
jgi:hypothetical protein